MTEAVDVVIVGGGVIGLSIALALAREGVRPTVLDRREMGREASWAGAGLIPPQADNPARPPLVALARGAPGSTQHGRNCFMPRRVSTSATGAPVALTWPGPILKIKNCWRPPAAGERWGSLTNGCQRATTRVSSRR